ncbi:hypothetical protein L810_2485 [Burkholderia sp. AU4i]|nr:hypothetical protein L810_2485 [Burkholderia sp. AU4i]
MRHAPGNGSGRRRRAGSAAKRVCPHRANPAGQARRGPFIERLHTKGSR